MSNKEEKRKINILLPSYGMKPVGGFKIAYMYANYLAKTGYQVHIYHAYKIKGEISPLDFIEDFLKMKWYRNQWMKFHSNIKLHYRLRLSSLFIRQADICVATAWNTAEKLNRFPSKKGSAVYLIQGYETWSGERRRVDETWIYPMKKIVISRWLEEIGKKMGAKDLVYIPNSISYKTYKITRPFNERKACIGMLYNPSQKGKGTKEGLECLKRLKELRPDLRAILFGTGPRQRNIPSWIEYFEDPKEEILVDEIYNRCTIFLCTSWSEGWGLPPMEAMACGCAVVTTKNGGVEDFCIHDKTALLSPIKDIDSLTENCFTLLSDPVLLEKIAIAGNRYIKKFRWNDSFEKFGEVIKDVIGKE